MIYRHWVPISDEKILVRGCFVSGLPPAPSSRLPAAGAMGRLQVR